jgi:hypothetical protein
VGCRCIDLGRGIRNIESAAAGDAGVATCTVRTGTEQQPNGRQDLDTIARSTCEQLSAAQAGATASAAAPQQPPAATQPAAPPPYVAPAAPATPAAPAQSGGWRSPDHMSYTNPAMVSADFYLEATLGADGGFQGSWARYVCFAGAYGIMSCGKGQLEGRASGRLEANGAGSIDLERLGRSALTWSQKSSNEIVIELPRTWQGENVLFRSTLKR